MYKTVHVFDKNSIKIFIANSEKFCVKVEQQEIKQSFCGKYWMDSRQFNNNLFKLIHNLLVNVEHRRLIAFFLFI